MEHPVTPPSVDRESTDMIRPGLRITASGEQSPENQGVSIQVSNEKKDTLGDSLMSDDEEPSMLDTLSSEQLARRPSFKKILDDLSAADQTLQKTSNPEQLMSSAAVLQAQQLLQQVGLANPSLFLQGGTSDQLSVMLPAQQQIALLQSMNAASPGVVQSLASQSNLSASLISSALINANVAAATLNNGSSSAINSELGIPVASGVKVGQTGSTLDDSNRKRDVRLMKNREAARECRRKKKEYVRCLESRVAVLESQNQALIGELRALKELYLPKSQDN